MGDSMAELVAVVLFGFILLGAIGAFTIGLYRRYQCLRDGHEWDGGIVMRQCNHCGKRDDLHGPVIPMLLIVLLIAPFLQAYLRVKQWRNSH